MNKLTVIGLGPGSKEYLTMGAFEQMKTGTKVMLRTEKHPVVDYIKSQGIEYESFDYLYDEIDDFDGVYKKIVEKLLNMLQKQCIVYAVPGSPFVAEFTVQLLIEAQKKEYFELEFIPAASFIEAILHTLRKDPIKGLNIVDGLRLDEQIINVKSDVIVTQVYNKMIASEVKLKLMEYYSDEHMVTIIRAAAIPGEEKIETVKLYELDHILWFDYLTSIYIPKVENTIENPTNMNDLVSIMKRLREKDGCPWDIEQTHESLKPYLIEESYEVLEAIDEKDSILLEEELGDLLLQVVFHAQIASESGEFDVRDVIKGICKKLIYRHPHVFRNKTADTADEAVSSWEDMKRQEKKEATYTDGLRRIPKHLPALMKSYKVQEKAADVGFDWDKVEEAIAKVREEFYEVLEVYKTDQKEKIIEELGDLLFAVVNVTRFLKVDPELALNKTVNKFIRRFSFIENAAIKNGKDMKEMTLEEMDELWNKAKIHKN